MWSCACGTPSGISNRILSCSKTHETLNSQIVYSRLLIDFGPTHHRFLLYHCHYGNLRVICKQLSQVFSPQSPPSRSYLSAGRSRCDRVPALRPWSHITHPLMWFTSCRVVTFVTSNSQRFWCVDQLVGGCRSNMALDVLSPLVAARRSQKMLSAPAQVLRAKEVNQAGSWSQNRISVYLAH